MKLSKLVLLVVLSGTFLTHEAFAKGGSSKPASSVKTEKEVESENEVENENETEKETESKATKAADKAAKEAAKLKEKQQKDADKALKDASKSSVKTDRIELLAKMKSPKAADDDLVAEVEENEASLKYRSRDGKISLTAEIEGFKDRDMFKMYIVINNVEILVASMEVIGGAGTIPRQEIEFDESTLPTGVPKVLSAGTIVRMRDSKGALVFESSLQPK